VVPEVADSYFATAINGIEDVAQSKRYHVIIYITHEDQFREQSILNEFKSGRADGVLLSVSPGNARQAHIEDLVRSNIPLVFFDRVSEHVTAPKVITNDFESGYKATEHLILKGCQNLFFLGLAEDLSITRQRQQGFIQALADHHKQCSEENVVHFSNKINDSLRIKNILETHVRPIGIVASTEKLTTLVYSACHELNRNIPNDVKVVGFSCMSTASLLNPSLTTISQPAFEMGKVAAALLFARLENAHDVTSEPILLPSQLVERQSTQ
jgi:LacI family transcriptional regulator